MRTIRKIIKEWRWFAVNTIGLAVSLAVLLVIFFHVKNEFSFDRFHSKAGRIYRVTVDSNNGATSTHPARVAGEWPNQLIDEYPSIENIVRLVSFRRAIVKIGDNKFYSEKAFSTDSSFFRIFDFKILSGNPEKALTQPGRVFISRSLAMKYFGNLNIIGKDISIQHQQVPSPKIYVIDGVMEDFPASSHFHADLLTSYTDAEEKKTWAYTYFLMKTGTDIEQITSSVQEKWKKESQSGEPVAILHLQKLTDIHLFSHKTREMEKNGDIRSIILLVSGAVIVLFIALINFMNLNRVRFFAGLKSIKLKLINGATKLRLAGTIAAESVILSVISLTAGLIIADSISKILNLPIFGINALPWILGISVGFVLTIAALSVLPLFTNPIKSSLNDTTPKGQVFPFPLILQFTLSILAISGAVVLKQQMNFILSSHPAARNANLVVISGNPWDVVQRYESLKNELLLYPEIVNMTAAMEEPGGDILDGVPFEMEGIEKKEGQSINIFTTDSNFFDVFNIKPLAGSVNLGTTSTQQWEAAAAELGTLRNAGANPEIIAEKEKNLGTFREKYILNESALRLLGIVTPEEAVGKRFRLNFFLADLFPEGEIAAVVPDFHYTNLHSEEKPLAIAPRKMFNYCFIISINPVSHERALSVIDAAWQKINPEIPLQFEFMTDSYQKVYSGEYAQSKVLVLFSLIAVIISALGVFSMASFKIQQRIREIGIRKVNGAQISEVMVLLNKDFVKWVLIAFLIATPIAWYAMHKWLENFAYKTELSWWIFALAGSLALGIALLTVSWQSWKAATRNPVEALRYE